VVENPRFLRNSGAGDLSPLPSERPLVGRPSRQTWVPKIEPHECCAAFGHRLSTCAAHRPAHTPLATVPRRRVLHGASAARGRGRRRSVGAAAARRQRGARAGGGDRRGGAAALVLRVAAVRRGRRAVGPLRPAAGRRAQRRTVRRLWAVGHGHPRLRLRTPPEGSNPRLADSRPAGLLLTRLALASGRARATTPTG